MRKNGTTILLVFLISLFASGIGKSYAAPLMLWPTESYRVTSEYGMRTIDGVRQFIVELI